MQRNLRKEDKNKESGITLIALIITVIIMVILAAVAINSIYNMGIVDKATKGSQDYAAESVKENQVIGNVENLIEDTIGNIERIENPEIPREYQKVEYIESTGTQWIDTGINGNSVYELYCGLDIVRIVNGNWANIVSANLDHLSLGTNETISSVYTRINWNYNYPATIENGICNDFFIV